MNALLKVLVVDSGQRAETDLLSTELAELGVSSVTTSLEAAEEVLEVIERPSAIFVNIPSRSDMRASLCKVAAALRRNQHTIGVPVIEWSREISLQAGGVSAVLTNEIGLQALYSEA